MSSADSFANSLDPYKDQQNVMILIRISKAQDLEIFELSTHDGLSCTGLYTSIFCCCEMLKSFIEECSGSVVECLASDRRVAT